MRIWKFKLEVTNEQFIEMPTGWKPLSVQSQGGQPVLWALVDENATPVMAAITMVGTGHPCDEVGQTATYYLGSVQTGPYVWHYFAKPN